MFLALVALNRSVGLFIVVEHPELKTCQFSGLNAFTLLTVTTSVSQPPPFPGGSSVPGHCSPSPPSSARGLRSACALWIDASRGLT